MTAITIEDISEWRGKDVLDPTDAKLGKLDSVLYDAETDTPTFVAVKSGTFSKRVTLVPLEGARAGQDYLRVAADKDVFKRAPSFEPDAALSLDDEADVYRHFGLEYRPAGQGARRLAKH
jgi:PRC-barrel domain